MASKGLRPGDIERLLNKNLGNINKNFRKELRVIRIADIIKDLILKGISPVFGVLGRFKQYSQSYIDQIQGRAKYFRFKSGKVVRVEPKMLEGERTSFKIVRKGPDKGKVIGGKTHKAKYEKFEKGLGVGKKISPVNLKKSGDMLATLKYNEATGEITAGHKVGKYNLWDIHNDGKGKIPERRLLPNREGERFNRRIDQKITEALYTAIGLGPKAKSKLKRFAMIKFTIK
jgi:hypothetical protein